MSAINLQISKWSCSEKPKDITHNQRAIYESNIIKEEIKFLERFTEH